MIIKTGEIQKAATEAEQEQKHILAHSLTPKQIVAELEMVFV